MRRFTIAAVLVVLVVASLAVAVAATTRAPSYWLVLADVPIEAVVPCGHAANVHTASLSTDGQLARIYYLCHDGRQFVRELLTELAQEASGMPSGSCRGGTVPGMNGYCVAPGSSLAWRRE